MRKTATGHNPEEKLAARQAKRNVSGTSPLGGRIKLRAELVYGWPGRFVVEEIRAKSEQHAILCRPADEGDGLEECLAAEEVVVCDDCERHYHAASLPKLCTTCSNLLQRFLVAA